MNLECNDIEKILNSLENKVDWVIDIRRLVENINKDNKNIIIERMFKMEDIFREICQVLNKTLSVSLRESYLSNIFCLKSSCFNFFFNSKYPIVGPK